jgi:hypothetical protein
VGARPFKSGVLSLLGRTPRAVPNADASVSGDGVASAEQPAHQPAEPAADSMTFNIAQEVERFFDDSSLAHGTQPVFKIFMGAGHTGKTTLRCAQCPEGYVVVDAAEVFLNRARGGVYDFPSFLAEPMNVVGGIVARYAVLERRHIATEFLTGSEDSIKGLLDAVTSLGYRIDVQMLTCDPEEAERRNQARGVDCISAYCAQEHQWDWLVAATQAAAQTLPQSQQAQK